jgi:hypothetical protein
MVSAEVTKVTGWGRGVRQVTALLGPLIRTVGVRKSSRAVRTFAEGFRGREQPITDPLKSLAKARKPRFKASLGHTSTTTT